jgi:murein DD-endopeptidase MepM/ murein hydrolase activator NlpD
MKTISIFLLMAMCSSLSYAQFNTVSPNSRVYKIAKEADTSNEISTSVDDDSNNKREVCDVENMKQQLILHYTSVSFPLKQLRVNSPFGKRKDPFTGKKAQHNGVDLFARNDEVYSIMLGDVIKSGVDRKSGIYVKMQYGEYTVSYCHLSKAVVKRGDIVNAGEIIGISGNTGTRSTGEHVHISVKYKSHYIDPTILFDYVRETQQECLQKLKELV